MDWGLGHASRCVPVIRAFMEAGCRVVVAASGRGAELLKREPGIYGGLLTIVPFPGFTVSYSRSFLFLKLLLQIPSFLYHMRAEKKMLGRLVREHGIGLVISDNRYGLVHPEVPSVMITHQLNPLLPPPLRILQRPVSMIIRGWVRRFDECWIPDCREEPACKKLIRGWERLPAVFFTGWLSRFPHAAAHAFNEDARHGAVPDGGSPEGLRRELRPFRYKVLFLLSGPEPQRTVLEGIILRKTENAGQKCLLVRGLPDGPHGTEKRGDTEIVSFLDSAKLLRAVGESELIVCRSGYSSVMDMLVTGKDALLVPTPGQTEQEYLGKRLGRKGWFTVVAQKRFDPGRIPVPVKREVHDGCSSDSGRLREVVEAVINRTGKKGGGGLPA